VADRGDGAGKDYCMSGLDHYTSWLTVGDRQDRLQLASTALPRTLTVTGMSTQDTACMHVQALDRVQNATADQVSCAAPLLPPQMPAWRELPTFVSANPTAAGLVGLDTWFWLAPAPGAITAGKSDRGIRYEVTATPTGADWEFGDGAFARFADASGFGQAYPQPSSVKHTYESHSESGYAVQASVRYEVTWTAVASGSHFGPYPLGALQLPAHRLHYPVVQAQPELLETGP
jgi:hypothetical protein